MRYNHPKIVQLLCEYGAMVNAWTNAKMTPLMVGCQAGSLKAVGVLVKQPGVSVFEVNEEGGIGALQYCCMNGNYELVSEAVTFVKHMLAKKHGPQAALNDYMKSKTGWYALSEVALETCANESCT